MTRRLISNVRLFDPAQGLDETGSLLIDDGRIADFGPSLTAAGIASDVETIDGDGHLLTPGLIDMRVFTGEPGTEYRETLGSASQSAAVGGVTSIIVMPNTDPVIDDVALVDFVKRRARDTAVVHVHPMAALSRGLQGEQMTEMGLLKDAGAVAFTDGDRSLSNPLVMRRMLSYAGFFDALVVQHAEDEDLTAGGVMNEGELASRLGLSGNPSAAETIMIERDLRLVELTGGRYHVSQVSCAASVEAIRQAKAKGLNVTCGVSAPHLTLNENDVASYRTFMKLSPPLRHEDDRQAVINGLKDGTIDVIVSGHDPHDPETKRLPFAQAAFGAVGLETLLPACLSLVHSGDVPLERIVEALTRAPASLLGLDAGRIDKGAPADLTLTNLNKPWILDGDTLKSKSKNTPYDERRFQGQAVCTIVAGNIVHTL